MNMDNLIAHISAGVGQNRRRKKRPVLISLGSKRRYDNILSSGDDSSDDDFEPPGYFDKFSFSVQICNINLIYFYFNNNKPVL